MQHEPLAVLCNAMRAMQWHALWLLHLHLLCSAVTLRSDAER
jgi:hypothetical protein